MVRTTSVVWLAAILGLTLSSVGCTKDDGSADDDDSAGEAGTAGTGGGGAGAGTSVGGTNAGGAGGAGGGSAGSSGGTGGSSGSGGSGQSGAAGSGGKAPDPPLDLGLEEPPPTGTFTDERDGREYKWVELDGVRWMAENLDFELQPYDISTCHYDAVAMAEQCEEYGFFYGWSAAHGQARIVSQLNVDLPDGTYQGICPEGWHLPTYAEWKALLDYVVELTGETPPDVGNALYTYLKLSDPFRSTTEWTARPGTNELSFDMKPYTESQIGRSASFWIADHKTGSAYRTVEVFDQDIRLDTDNQEFRHSIRCVAGEATQTFPAIEFPPPTNTTGTMTDARDEKTYATTTIGTQTWTAENLAYEPSSGSLCYADQEEHCRLFGRLYAYDTAQTICPTGWHLPTVDEWRTLALFIDADTGGTGGTIDGNISSFPIGQYLINSVVWDSAPDVDPEYGFNALPGGWALDDPTSGTLGDDTSFWTATTDEDQIAVDVYPNQLTTAPVRDGVYAAVRCLED